MYFQRKFKDFLTIVGFDGGKDSEPEAQTINEERMERHALEQTKKSVKRMHRADKLDAAFKGRQKIQNLFARGGIFLNI